MQRVKDVLGYKTGSRGLSVQARTAANNGNDCGAFVVKLAEGAVRAEAVAECLINTKGSRTELSPVQNARI
jgi:ribosomal protein S28E/S33